MPLDHEQEAAGFLERDFNQCFAQMRHYDAQIWGICRFTFTGYTALLGISIGLYKYAMDGGVQLGPAIIAALGTGVTLGIFMFGLAVRNRAYYVQVTRYVNEHRRLFLAGNPLGFVNRTRMHTDPARPRFCDWRSSQVWLANIIALLNAVLLAVLSVVALGEFRYHVVVLFIITAGVQIGLGSRYLHAEEKRAEFTVTSGDQ